MSSDARICTSLPSHPKTKKLIRRLGVGGAWSLVCLILWVAANRSDGRLTGMSDEDIELAAEWGGEDGALVRELVAVRYLDGVEDARSMHDWAEHNPWAAGADMRSAKARWNAAKRHHGVAEADRQVPEYAAVRSTDAPQSHAASNANSMDSAGTEQDGSNAPSPSPSPSPSPYPKTGGESASERTPPQPAQPPADAGPPPTPTDPSDFRPEYREVIATQRPDLTATAQQVWLLFCEHYPAKQRGISRWTKWVMNEKPAGPGVPAGGGLGVAAGAEVTVPSPPGVDKTLARILAEDRHLKPMPPELREQWRNRKKFNEPAAMEAEK